MVLGTLREFQLGRTGKNMLACQLDGVLAYKKLPVSKRVPRMMRFSANYAPLNNLLILDEQGKVGTHGGGCEDMLGVSRKVFSLNHEGRIPMKHLISF